MCTLGKLTTGGCGNLWWISFQNILSEDFSRWDNFMEANAYEIFC